MICSGKRSRRVTLASRICWTCATKALPTSELPKPAIPSYSPRSYFPCTFVSLQSMLLFKWYIQWRSFPGLHNPSLSSSSSAIAACWPILGPKLSDFKAQENLTQNAVLITIPGYPGDGLHCWNFSKPSLHLNEPISHVYQTVILCKYKTKYAPGQFGLTQPQLERSRSYRRNAALFLIHTEH